MMAYIKQTEIFWLNMAVKAAMDVPFGNLEYYLTTISALLASVRCGSNNFKLASHLNYDSTILNKSEAP